MRGLEAVTMNYEDGGRVRNPGDVSDPQGDAAKAEAEERRSAEAYEQATASTTTEPIALVGDVAGHEFHGNQHTGAAGKAEKAKDYDAHSLAQDYHISKAMNAGGGKVQDAHDHAAALHEAAKNAATDQYGLPTKNPERFQRLSAKAREASKKAHAIEKN